MFCRPMVGAERCMWREGLAKTGVETSRLIDEFARPS